MFWIYLALFTLGVLVPFVIERPYFYFSEEIAEALLLFLFGFCAFLLYSVKEYNLLRFISEKIHLQKTSARAKRDLSASYSYIGEANRKVDILKKALSQASILSQTKNEKREAFSSLITALSALAQTKKFLVRIVDLKHAKTLKEFHGEKPFNSSAHNKNLCMLHAQNAIQNVHNAEPHTVITPRHTIDQVAIFFIAEKNDSLLDDRDFFETLCIHILFLFIMKDK